MASARLSETRLGLAAALVGGAVARVIDEDPPHHHRGHANELGAVRPVHLPLVDQPEIRLVDERGGLQGVAGALTGQKRARQSPQLVVDERQHLVAGVLVAPATGMCDRVCGTEAR